MTRFAVFLNFKVTNYLLKSIPHLKLLLELFVKALLVKLTCVVAIFGQVLEIFGLLLFPTSGHTTPKQWIFAKNLNHGIVKSLPIF